MDVAAFLQDFCALANAELACRDAKAHITLDLPAAPLCLPASEALLTSLFTNLLTNSVHARRDAAITIGRSAGGVLRYADTGPGPGAEALALLRGGAVSMTLLHTGALGLLVALACAKDLGWAVTLDDSAPQGFAIEMRLPEPLPAAAAPALHSAPVTEALRARLQRLLRREMDLALR